jgi:RNA polymerase sigma-70 factor (ECF subfamily)
MIGDDFAQVLAAAQEGRADAFARIFRDVQPALLRYLGVISPGRADDLASETWLEVVKRLGRFSGEESGFRSWVFTIARSKSVDAARTAVRRPTTPLDESLHDQPDDRDDPAARLQQVQATEEALSLIATLPEAQAEAVLLRVLVGLDVPETAAVMKKSEGAVRALSHRGLRTLESRLSPVRGEGGVTE